MPFGNVSPIPNSAAGPRVCRATLLAHAERLTRRAARLRDAGREVEAAGAETRAADAWARAHDPAATRPGVSA